MVMMQTQKVKPFVRFEIRPYGLDEKASKEAGRPVERMEEFICITSHGSKDSSDQLVREWLPRKRREAEQGMYDPDWVDYFERSYEKWKKVGEVPRDGTPILTWQMVTPEQSARLRALGITTVEDLSAMPDNGMEFIGLDARYLRDLARNWVNEGQQKGINAQELAQAQVKLRDQATTIELLQRRIEALEAAQGEDKPRKGRKAKSDTLMEDED